LIISFLSIVFHRSYLLWCLVGRMLVPVYETYDAEDFREMISLELWI
jgi:ABC-type thiamin/hydroxymethylpyrimidine transport system permease subunit